MQIVVNQLLTHYELSGKGKLVVLLHGWGDNVTTFQALSADLSKRYQVLAIDLPGFGGTQVPTGVWDLDDYAAFVAAVLTKLEMPKPHALIGHSNGGAVSIMAISLGILKPQKLVLLASAGVRTAGSPRRTGLMLIAKLGNAATIWMPQRYRTALRKSLYGAAGSDMLVVPALQETFKKTVRHDVQADAQNVSIPTLLIYGADDAATPPAHGKLLAGHIPRSHLEVLEHAGHFVHHDQAATVNQLIGAFL